MVRLTCISFAAALLLTPNVTTRALPQANADPKITRDQQVPVLPKFDKDTDSDQSSAPPQAPDTTNNGPMKEESRLEIVRYVSGEFARMVTPFPGGKSGFRVKAGEPVDQEALRRAIQAGGAALNPGDNVQITKIDFQGHQLMVELNGGSRGKRSWRDHVQLSMGGASPMHGSSSTTTRDENGQPVVAQKAGATLYLDFGRSLPDMTPDELKQYLAVVLDFSKQRSAAVQWASTLPPKVQEAITQKRPDLGMDREEILAAIGRPDRKVRERDIEGNDTEDWIYGHPPSKTIFVRFSGDKVVKIEQFP
jgi:hypothetical protein